MDVFVDKSAALREGDRRLVPHKGQEIGVVRAKGNLYAYANICPHQGGPVCEGVLIHQVKEVIGADKTYAGMTYTDGLNVVCPWHGWEFDIETGRCAGDGKHALRRFEVFEKEGDVYVRV